MAEPASKEEDYDSAFRLVGEFIHTWALLERRVNDGIERLLGLPPLEATALLANMPVRDKIQALKTLLHLFGPSETARTEALSLLARVAKLNDDRNRVAHNLFWPHEKGGVSFALVQARGKLNFPKVVWTEEMFADKLVEMVDLSKALRSAVSGAAGYRSATIRSRTPSMIGNIFANALRADASPTSDTGLLSLASFQPLQPPESQNSLQASPETAPQTQPKKRASKPKAPRSKAKG